MHRAKGFASIVAAVSLTVVSAVGAMMIYLWLACFITKAVEQMTALEVLKIEAAVLDDAGSAVLYVRNLGGDAVTLATAYILRPGTIKPICGPASLNAAINPGALATVSISFTGCTLSAGNYYVIKIVTQKGTEFAVMVTAS